MNANNQRAVVMIPVDRIHVLNPRVRNKKKFQEIVNNIARLGLKKPITVRRNEDDTFDLACGQGRLEACVALGWTEIPAIIVDGSVEDCLLMSLSENIGVRRRTALEQIESIRSMRQRGHSNEEIARKTDLSANYISEILRLVENGEERLITAVDRGEISMSTAKLIAETEDKSLQAALREAFQKKLIPANELRRARKVAEVRGLVGKGNKPIRNARTRKATTLNGLLKEYQEDAQRHKLMIKNAKVCEARVLFVLSALKKLFNEDHFVTLLRAEGIDTAPKPLMDRLAANAEV